MRLLRPVIMHQCFHSTKTTPNRLCQRQRCPVWQSLPLRILTRQKLIQNAYNLLQTLQPRVQLLAHSRLVITKLRIEVLPVGRRTHGGTEDGLHDKAMVLFQGIAVCISEGIGQFFGRGAEVPAECLRCEVEAAIEPEQAFSSGVFLSFELGFD